MDELAEKYNNNFLRIELLNDEYTGVFRKVNELLCIEVQIDDNNKLMKIWNKSIFGMVNAVCSESPIVLLNLFARRLKGNKITFEIDILIDGFYIGKRISNKKISSFLCSYIGTDGFDLSKYYDFKPSEATVRAICENDNYTLKTGKLTYHRTNRMSFKYNRFSFFKLNEFEFSYLKNVSMETVLKDIWHIKNLLSIFSKKYIAVQKIELLNSKHEKADVYMNYIKKPCLIFQNEMIEHENSRYIIKYNDIKNDFSNILKKSKMCFNEISQIIGMYLDSMETQMPRINGFLAFCQMVEGFSREYDEQGAKISMIKKEPKKIKNDPELKYRIYSLIKRTNFIFKLSYSRIMKVAEKISKGRNYYTHNNKSQKIYELSYNELSQFRCFLEDVLLANIYLQIGISKEIISNSLNGSFYYDINRIS